MSDVTAPRLSSHERVCKGRPAPNQDNSHLPSRGCGSKPMVPFWGRCTTHFCRDFSWDWDVHWGYVLDFDPSPCDSTALAVSTFPLESSLSPRVLPALSVGDHDHSEGGPCGHVAGLGNKIAGESRSWCIAFVSWLWLKNPVPKYGTLVSGNMNQHLRNPSCLILSHTQVTLWWLDCRAQSN